MVKNTTRERKVQPTFRVYPSTIELYKDLKEKGVDVAGVIDNALRRQARRYGL